MKTPEGPARRALRMAALTAGVTGSYVGYLAQRAFLTPQVREQKLKAAHTRAAKKMTAELLTLRGPAMKLGQSLSLQEGLLPEEMLQELGNLQRGASGMHPTMARAQFRAAMGKPPEALFRQFEDEPFAAASLGQVHRARLRDGSWAAVKIQYPGIADAVASDFRWFRAASKGAQITRHLPEPTLAELEAQIRSESDYVREAQNLERFRKRLGVFDWVTVPKVYRRLSGDRVITMELLDGMHLDEWLRTRPSQQLRDLVGARLVELYYYQVLRVEAFHADPHWGNYLFRKDGGIGLLDFGCVKELSTPFVDTLRAVFLYPDDRTGAGFEALMHRRYALHGQKLSPSALKALSRFAETFYRMVYPPEQERDGEPFDFSDDRCLRTYMRESARLARSRVALPEYLMLARAETGLYGTLHRLKARVPMSRIVRTMLA